MNLNIKTQDSNLCLIEIPFQIISGKEFFYFDSALITSTSYPSGSVTK